MEAEGRLTARVKVPFHLKPHMELAELDRANADDGGVRRRLGVSRASSRCSWTGWWTAAPPICWTTIPGSRGTGRCPLFEPERFKAICDRDRPARAADRRACHRRRRRCAPTIDGYEAARQANGPRDSRHRIEHIELIDRADVPRLGALGITASRPAAASAGGDGFPAVDDGARCSTATAGGTPICGRRWPIPARRWPLPATGR